MYQEIKNYKHSPEVRAAMAQLQREYRSRKKVREAQVSEAGTPLTCQTPESPIQTNKVSCING